MKNDKVQNRKGGGKGGSRGGGKYAIFRKGIKHKHRLKVFIYSCVVDYSNGRVVEMMC